MTLFIAFAVLYHMDAGIGWYIMAIVIWLLHTYVWNYNFDEINARLKRVEQDIRKDQ